MGIFINAIFVSITIGLAAFYLVDFVFGLLCFLAAGGAQFFVLQIMTEIEDNIIRVVGKLEEIEQNTGRTD